MLPKFPYTDAHQLNLDWIIKRMKQIPTKISQLINDSGFINASQAAAVSPVQSVNGQTGAVVLSAVDVGAFPSAIVDVPSGSEATIALASGTRAMILCNGIIADVMGIIALACNSTGTTAIATTIGSLSRLAVSNTGSTIKIKNNSTAQLSACLIQWVGSSPTITIT